VAKVINFAQLIQVLLSLRIIQVALGRAFSQNWCSAAHYRWRLLDSSVFLNAQRQNDVAVLGCGVNMPAIQMLAYTLQKLPLHFCPKMLNTVTVKTSKTKHTHTHTTILWLSGFCPGQHG